jgi:hypothetical protein
MAKSRTNKVENDAKETAQMETGGGPGLGLDAGDDLLLANPRQSVPAAAVAGDLPDSDAALSEAAHGDDEGPLVARGKQGDEGRPCCPRHNVLMVTYCSKSTTTHYKCPVDGCKETGKRTRPQSIVPREVQRCPVRSCAVANGGEAAALERDDRLSRGRLQIAMVCPRCGFQLNQPRPDGPGLAALRHSRARDLAAQDLGER